MGHKMIGGALFMDNRIEVPIEILRDFGERALIAAGVDTEVAKVVTEVQLEAAIRGQITHNIGDIPRYAERVRSGQINPSPKMSIERESAVHALYDADGAPGQYAGVVAMRKCIEKSKTQAIATVGVRNSNHYGASGYYASMAVAHNLIGLCTTNAGSSMAPWGGAEHRIGNNPLGVAIPTANSYPVMLDVAMSVVAVGKIALSIAQGKGLPAGWMIDAEGRPTTDPDDFSTGSALPIADHKGYGLTMIMEILSGVLTGSGFGTDHNWRDKPNNSAEPEDLGHFFLTINPAMFMPIEDFKERMEALIKQLKSSKLAPGVSQITVPGEPEYDARARNLKHGTVPMLVTTYDGVKAYIEEQKLGIDIPAS